MSLSPEQDLQSPTDSLLKPKKWTRVCGRKVKTGCRTCKIRRIKCDEQKPECFRCQISGRKCDGYARTDSAELRSPRRSSDGMRRSPSTGGSSPSPTITAPLQIEITGEQFELRAFHHYRARTAEELSGCFQSNFWTRLVLQLAHTEPAIKHAVIAVASAHEKYQTGSEASNDTAALELQQYNKAIVCLKQHLSIPTKHSTEVALICCALFICFEALRGNYESALLHLQSGIDIIKSWKAIGDGTSNSQVPYLDHDTDEDELIELFTRLDFSASAFVPSRAPQMVPRLPDPAAEMNVQSLSHARRSLERLVNRTIFFMIQSYATGPVTTDPDTQPKPSPEQDALLAAVSAWSIQFDQLLKSPQMTNLSGKDLLGAFTLILHKKTLSIMLQTCHYELSSAPTSPASPSSESVFGQFAADIDSIVSIAAFVASPINSSNTPAHKPDMSQPRGQPKFTSDMGIIAPLHYTLLHCRDPAVREKAVGILRETKRREGIWDSGFIAEIAQHSGPNQGPRSRAPSLPSGDDVLQSTEWSPDGYQASEAMGL